MKLFFTIPLILLLAISGRADLRSTDIYLRFATIVDTIFPRTPVYGRSLTEENKSLDIDRFYNELSSAPRKSLRVTGSIHLTVTTTGTSCGYNNGSIIVTATGGVPPYKYILNGYTYNTGNFPQRSAGTYSLAVSDAAGNSTGTTVLLENNLEAPAIKIKSYTRTSACDVPDAGFVLEASGGKPPYEFSMDRINFQTSNTFSGLPGGFYTFFVRDANGCIKSVKSPLSWNGTCQPSVIIDHSVAACTNDGKIRMEETFSSNGPLQYSRDGINYTASGAFDHLASGIHRIYIKDASNKITLFAITILQNCSLDIRFISTEAECMLNDGSLTVNVANGAPPYQYSLDGVHFQSENIFTELASGEYIVTVKDNNGTTLAGNGSVYDKCPLVQGVPTHVTCLGADGKITATATKGMPPYQFSIDGSTWQSGGTFTGLSAGSYFLKVKDTKGHTHTRQIIVNNTCLKLSVATTSPTCDMSNGSISVEASNGTAPYRYAIDGLNLQANNKFTLLKGGTYTITAEDSQGKKGSITVALINVAGPELSVTVKPESCTLNDGAILAEGTGGRQPYQFSLDGVVFQSNADFLTKGAGSYTVLIKDANGCTASQSLEIVRSCPLISMEVTDEMCNDRQGKIAVSATQGTSPYQYSLNNGSFQSNNIFERLKAGKYTVNVKDALGILVSVDTTLADNCPVVNATVSDGYCGVSNGSIHAEGSRGMPPYGFSLDGINYQTSGLFSGLPAGKYNITIKDSKGNQNSTESAVFNHPAPQLSAQVKPASCLNNDGLIVLTSESGTPPITYSLNNVEYFRNNEITNLTAGVYKVFAKDANGCIDSTQVSVDTIMNLWLKTPMHREVCEGGQLQLQVESNATDYRWNPNAGLNSGIIRNPVVSATSSVKYLITASLDVCNITDSVLISVLPAPKAVALPDDTTICYGQSVQIYGSGGTNFIWTPSIFLSNANISNPVVTQPLYATVYRLKVIDNNGCSSIEDAIVSVTVTPPPQVFAGNDTAVIINQPFQLNARDINNSGFTNYTWQPDIGLTINNRPNPVLTIDRNMTYYLTASTSAGCKAMDTISIRAYLRPDIYVPSAFSPNKDGLNDVLKAFPVGVKQFDYFAVFDRWGKKVFFTSDYKDGWDGSVSGEYPPTSTFSWFAQGQDERGQRIVRKGTVTLIR